MNDVNQYFRKHLKVKKVGVFIIGLFTQSWEFAVFV